MEGPKINKDFDIIKLPFVFRILALTLLLGVFHPLPGQAASDLRSLKSGVWVGAVRGNDQGNPTSCYLAARKNNDEFWIILKLDDAGLHVLLYNKNWTLRKGKTFRSRVVIDKHLFGKVKATIPTTTGFDFLIGNDEPSMESIQSGRHITFATPKGKKTFRLQGTRRAVNVLLDCADKYLTSDTNRGAHSYQAGVDAFNNKDYGAALGHFRSMAEAGDAASQNALGILYYNGLGVGKDFATAAQWFQRAADQNLARAQNNLGEMYRDGEGVPQDDVRALKLFRAAAINGSNQATKNITAMLAKGRTGADVGQDTSASDDVTEGTLAASTEPNLGDISLAGQWRTSFGETAIIWDGKQYKGSYVAENGNTDDNGSFRLWLNKDGKLSGIWTEPASSHKCTTARMGSYYWGHLRQVGPVSTSGFSIVWGYCGDGLLKNSWDFVSKRAEAGGAGTATAAGASATGSSGNPSDAESLLNRAMGILAEALPGSPADAFDLADKAAGLGNAQAKYMSGLMLIDGVGVAIDRKLGIARMLAAAQAGDMDALTFMGIQYLQDGDESTNKTGTDYLSRAADMGSTEAQSALTFYRSEASQ